MLYLLDTNVISEPTKKRPSAEVLAWLAGVALEATAVSLVTIAEIRWGIRQPIRSDRRDQLQRWFDTVVLPAYETRTLDVTRDVIECWFDLASRTQAVGRPRDLRDLLIAATAVTHQLTLVTLNARDFAYTGATILDPSTGRVQSVELP